MATGVTEGGGLDLATGSNAVAQRAPTKAALVLSLIERDQGATLTKLVEATGWIPHTTRPALTQLHKRSHVLHTSTRAGATCYKLDAA